MKLDGGLLHCADICNSASTHTQIHIHTDFLLRVSVYVSVLGLQGFGMSLDPGLRHTRTGLPQDVRRVWCSSFLILPQTLGRIQDMLHTVVKKPFARDWVSPTIENGPKMSQRW